MAANSEESLEKQLQLILKVLAAYTVDGKSLTEGAPFLDRLGVNRSIIADIYATTPASVRGILSQVKKASESKTGKARVKKDVKS